MAGSVEIEESAVTEVIAKLRTRATTWSGHGTNLKITGLGTEVYDKAQAAIEVWKTEFTTASTGVTQLADRVQTDLDAWKALDSGMGDDETEDTP